jgi:hypothetical protein
MRIWIVEGTQIFKCRLYYFKFKLSSLSGILLTQSVLHAIHGFRWQICMRCSILYMQTTASIILFKFEIFLKFIVTVVQNELRLTEKMSLSHKKSNLFAFVHSFQRVTDYLLQHLQKLFEPF